MGPVRVMFVLLVTALLVLPVQAEELHRLGAIYEPELPDWVQPSPWIELENGQRELDEFVDNSAGLPPIGNQGSQGSCTAWATAYYYLTYTQGQDYGWDLTDPAHQMSPAFTYNLINRGEDGGSQPSDAFLLFETMGCGTYEDMPYTQSNYTRFPSEETWRNGIPFRTSATYQINTYSQSGINQLKTHLSNGNIAMIAITVWPNFDNISNYNYNYCVNDIYGEVRGGHAVTVVGYDDSRVTSDGVGAFKMVNSWGPYWGQSGFWWMSYEAFMSNQICWGYALYAGDIPQYEAELVACVGVEHSDRYQLDWQLGLGTCDNEIATTQYLNFSGWGGVPDIPFPEDACIVFDLTQYMDQISLDQPNELFLEVADGNSYDGNGGSLLDVRIEDLVNDHIAQCYTLPAPIPDNNGEAGADLVLYHNAVAPEWLTSALNIGEGEVHLTWPSVPVGNDFIGYNVYRNGELLDFTEETTYTDQLPGFGQYDYVVASLWEPCPSPPSETSSLMWYEPMEASYPELAALDGATGAYTLTWEQLRPYEVVQDDGSADQPLFFNGAAPPGAMFAQRVTTQEDGKLTGIKVWFMDGDYPMQPVRFRVFAENDNGQPGEVLCSTQQFTPQAGSWNLRDLGELRPTVQAGDPLWLAVVYSQPESSPVGLDHQSDSEGMMMCPDGSNWIVMNSGGAMMIRAEFGEEEYVNQATGLLGFEVYRDGELIETVNSDVHESSGVLPESGSYTFRVDAVYQQGVWAGEDFTFNWDGFTRVAEAATLPEEYEVSAAYPNPFNSATTVNVTMPQAGELDVRVYNLLGQEVARLAKGRMAAGSHRLLFDARDLASGVYLLRATIPGQLEKQLKLVYLR